MWARGRFRELPDLGQILVARLVGLLLMRVDERGGAMRHQRIAFLDLGRLRECLVVAAAHEAGRHRVELDEAEAGVEKIGIELDGFLEFVLRLSSQRSLAEDARLLRLRTVGGAEEVVRLGALRILRDRFLEQRGRGIGVIAVHGGAALIDAARFARTEEGR